MPPEKEVTVTVTFYADKKHSVLYKSNEGWGIYIPKAILEQLGVDKSKDDVVVVFQA